MNTPLRILGWIIVIVGVIGAEFRAPAWTANEPFPGFALFASGRIATEIQLFGWLIILWARTRRLEDQIKRQ